LRKAALNMQLEATLIIAITCTDGVVFASDGLELHLINNEYIRSKTRKIFRFGENRLWGCSGRADDIIRFGDFFSEILDETTKNHPLTESQLNEHLKKFAGKIEKDAETEVLFPSSRKRCPEYLVVGHQEYPMIWQMANNCESGFFGKNQHKMTDCRIYHIGIGSGQLIARALFERVKDVCGGYTLTQGSLVAYRIIKEAIKGSQLVEEPIYIWTISNDKVKPKKDAELKKLKILSDKWEDKERRVSQDFLSSLE